MAEKIVINTGPLISIDRADRAEVIGKLPYEFICPTEVSREIAAGILKGYPIAEPDWLMPTTLTASLDPVATAALDVGEAAALQLAKELGIDRVCIDERKGHRHARSSQPRQDIGDHYPGCSAYHQAPACGHLYR